MVKIALLSETDLRPNGFSSLEPLTGDRPEGAEGIEIFCGTVEGAMVYLVPRQQTYLMPEGPLVAERYKVLFRALKELGCLNVFSASWCASLQEEIRPGEFIIPDQFIDLSTHKRVEGMSELSRQQMSDPFSWEMRDHLTEAAIIHGITVHTKGTVVTPCQDRHATRAESLLYHKWGGDITGISASAEAIAACAGGLEYAHVSFCRMYDAWRLPSPDMPAQEEVDKGYYRIFDIFQYAIKKIVLK